jgi:hypothetical protein
MMIFRSIFPGVSVCEEEKEKENAILYALVDFDAINETRKEHDLFTLYYFLALRKEMLNHNTIQLFKLVYYGILPVLKETIDIIRTTQMFQPKFLLVLAKARYGTDLAYTRFCQIETEAKPTISIFFSLDFLKSLLSFPTPDCFLQTVRFTFLHEVGHNYYGDLKIQNIKTINLHYLPSVAAGIAVGSLWAFSIPGAIMAFTGFQTSFFYFYRGKEFQREYRTDEFALHLGFSEQTRIQNVQDAIIALHCGLPFALASSQKKDVQARSKIVELLGRLASFFYSKKWLRLGKLVDPYLNQGMRLKSFLDHVQKRTNTTCQDYLTWLTNSQEVRRLHPQSDVFPKDDFAILRNHWQV